MKTLTLNFKDGFDEYDDSIIFVSIDGYKKSPLFYYIDTVGFDRTPLIFSDKISNLFTKIFLNFENCITTVKNNDKFQLNSLGLKSEYFNNWLSCEFLNEAFDKEHQFAFLISNDSVRMSIAKKSKIFLTVYDFYAEEDKLRNFAKNFSKELH